MIASLRQMPFARGMLRFLALFVLWIALTGSTALQELVAGAVVAAIGAGFAGLILPPSPRRRSRRRGDRPVIVQLVEPLVRLPLDTLVLARALWGSRVRGHQLRGRLLASPLRGNPLLGEWWGSIAPCRYVIGIDEEDETMLIHELGAGEHDPGA